MNDSIVDKLQCSQKICFARSICTKDCDKRKQTGFCGPVPHDRLTEILMARSYEGNFLGGGNRPEIFDAK